MSRETVEIKSFRRREDFDKCLSLRRLDKKKKGRFRAKITPAKLLGTSHGNVQTSQCGGAKMRLPAAGKGESARRIHLGYITEGTSTNDSDTRTPPTLIRVPTVRSDLHLLAHLTPHNCNSQSNPKLTQTLESYPSLNKPTANVFELFENANMSAEKAVNPKEKLEGMYKSEILHELLSP
jgi:hypothetical protein